MPKEKDSLDFVISVREIAIENKFGIYGQDENEQGKTLSSILRIEGSVVPSKPLDAIMLTLDEHLDQAFDIVKRAVERASEEEAEPSVEEEEGKGW